MLKKVAFAVSVAIVATCYADGTKPVSPGCADWNRLNAAAREQANVPIRAGVPGERPFWNAHAKAFIHPPAFDFKETAGAKEYRFALARHVEDNAPCQDGHGRAGCPQPAASVRSWTAAKPWAPIPADIWGSLKPGYYTLRAEAVSGRDGARPSQAGERTFYRSAVFQGPYPKGARGYRDAARRVYAAVYNMPQVQGWKTSDEPPKGYDLYCYPAKILSSMIRALCRHAKGGLQRVATGSDAINCVPPDACAPARDCAFDAGPGGRDKRVPPDADSALAIARKMADWLMAHSQPEGTPLAHFPPTYWGDRRDVAVRYAGQNMLGYPAHAANAYFDLAEATGEAKYRDAALAIARTFLKLQDKDGTWPLKVLEKDGSPVRANRLVPNRYLLGMFDRAVEMGGSCLSRPKDGGRDKCVPPVAFAEARDRAFAYVLEGPAKTWNWDGQFEDMDPMPPYRNLQKGVAIDTALRLFAMGRTDEACEMVDWCEDQFVVWSDPIHNMDWKNWKMPTALEQYDYYTPIDASMGDMIGGFAAAYKATGNRLYLEKAKALADNITRHQREDGTIPTYFDSRKGSDWVNCMVYVADRLEYLASVCP